MTGLFFCLFLFLICSVSETSSAEMTPREALKVFGEGRALLQKKHYGEAVEAFNRALELTPGDAAMRVMIGIQLLKQKPDQLKKAAYKLFRAATRIDRNNFIANRILGDWYFNRFFFRESAGRYRRALKSRPEDPDTINNLAISLDGLKRFKEAEETAELAVKYSKKKGRYRVGLAWVYVDWRKPEKALKALRKVKEPAKLQRNDRNLFYRVRAEAYFLSESPEKAVSDLKKLTAVSPRYAKAYQLLGLYLQQLERYKEAENVFRKAISVDPANEKAHYGLGVVCMRIGKREEGKKELEIFNKLSKKRQKKRLSDLEEMSKELGERQRRGWIPGMGRK